MNQVLLDKDVWSFVFKRDSRAERYRAHLEGNVLCLSFQTVAELYQWAEKANWSEKRWTQMREWIKYFQILFPDNTTLQIWARIRAERERQGQPIAAQDAWIAACALRHECPLLTNNAPDYTGIAGLMVVSEMI